MYKAETPSWQQNMAERHAEKMADENAALREALRLKELECDALASDRAVLINFAEKAAYDNPSKITMVNEAKCILVNIKGGE